MTSTPPTKGRPITSLKGRSVSAPRKITRDLVLQLEPRKAPYEIRDTEIRGFLVRVQPSGLSTYYVEIRRGKRLKIGRTAALKTAVARNRAERIIGNVANDRPPWEGIREEADGAPTLGEFIAGDPEQEDVRKWTGDYATWYSANRKAGRAYTENMQRLKAVFALWWGLPLTEITAGMLESFKTDRKRKHKNSNATIRRDLSRLRGVFRLARKRGFRNDAFEHVELPDVDSAPKVRYLSEAERKRLDAALGIEATPQYLVAMVRVSLNTGLRRGELFGLTWQNVDIRRGVITVEGATSKRTTTRHVPINATTKAALTDWQKISGHRTGLVFPGRKGKFWTVKRAWASLLDRAEIKNFRWHDMRHDFASRLVMKGIDLYTVGSLLGHDRIETTQRYAHLAPEHRAAAVGALDE